MKISNSFFLAAVASFATSAFAAEGGLKAAAKQLQRELKEPTADQQALIDQCVNSGLCTGDAHFNSGEVSTRNTTNPSLEALEAVYDGFCTLCEFSALVNADQALCFLCNLDLDGDDVDGNDPDVIDIPTICFSEVATVQVKNVGPVAMKDLQVGASVLTGSGSYETVYAWAHRNPTKAANFLQLETNNNAKLEMSSGHMVFLQGKSNPVRADSIKVGDILQGEATVQKIQTIQREGVYSPLTPSGTVVVDGITASSYVSLQKENAEYVTLQGGFAVMSWQQLIHMSLSPFRLATQGISSAFGNMYNEDGLPHYAAYGMDLLLWLDQQNIIVQMVAFAATMTVFGISMILENTFGASMAPFAVAAGAVVYFGIKKSGVSYKIKSV